MGLSVELSAIAETMVWYNQSVFLIPTVISIHSFYHCPLISPVWLYRFKSVAQLYLITKKNSL